MVESSGKVTRSCAFPRGFSGPGAVRWRDTIGSPPSAAAWLELMPLETTWIDEGALKLTAYPLLVLHGSGDATCPLKGTRAVLRAAGVEGALRAFPEAGHDLLVGASGDSACSQAFEWLQETR